MGDVVTTKKLSKWRYESLPKWGVCAIGKTTMKVRLALRCDGANVFPDVDEVERWLNAFLAKPTTAEHLAVEASVRWKADADVVLEAATHGPIAASCCHND